MLGIIRGNFFLFFTFFELFNGITTMIANRNAKLLTNFLDVLNQFLAPFLRKLRNRHSDNLTVVVWGQSEVSFENCFFDIRHGTAVVTLHHMSSRLGSTQGS